MSRKKNTAQNTKTAAPAKAPAPTKAAGKAKMPLLSAAAEILRETGEAMNCRRMVETAKERGLWTPGAGKTPEQTLYSAIAREIKTKGPASRFRKAGARGHYSWNGSAG